MKSGLGGSRAHDSARSRLGRKAELAPRHDRRTRSYDALDRVYEQGRWIRALKYALPIAALLLIAVAVVWPSIFPENPHPASIEIEDVAPSPGNDVRVLNPRYAGVDARGRPFLITAKRAFQDPDDQSVVHLSNLQADITLPDTQQAKGETWLSVMAPSGTYNSDTQVLHLDKGADIYSNKGYELHAPQVHLDLKKNLAQGSQGIEAHGPLGKFSAAKFRILEEDRVTLTGNVHASYYEGFDQ